MVLDVSFVIEAYPIIRVGQNPELSDDIKRKFSALEREKWYKPKDFLSSKSGVILMK